MVYETSYESGRKPFRPDTTRGHWGAPSDFLFAGLASAFKMDVFSIAWLYFVDIGIFAVIPYVICLALFVVPIMVMQSFMGQFSSSGFISAFRIAPLFKGMGYISLALNFAIATYYSIFAAVPLLYLLNSFYPTLPWSCEAYEHWRKPSNDTKYERISVCNLTQTEIESLSTTTVDEGNNTTEAPYHSRNDIEIPSAQFFMNQFKEFNFYNENHDEFSMSWELIGCNFLTWAIIAFIFIRWFDAEKLGRFLRYSICATLVVLVICLIRFAFLPGAFKPVKTLFELKPRDFEYGVANVPFYAMSAFGAGWGSVVSFSSLNKFKTNIMRYCWLIGLGQMFICILFGMVTSMVEAHFNEITDFKHYFWYADHHWIMFLSSGSALANMGWPNLWCILFYSMLTMAAVIMLVTQIYSILLSVFDEFEELRSRKKEITTGMIAVLSVFSLYFCSNHGMVYFTALSVDSLFTQTALNLLLILVVLWIYGRERFQRDIEFMLGQKFSTCKVNMLRFVSPICLIIILLTLIIIAIFEHIYSALIVQIVAIFLVVIPWIFIPGYAIFILVQSSGSFGMRFKRCCRPTDWYPAEADDRERYEEAMGNMDITHQLHEVSEEVF